ncbi:MAG: 2Fe-2S iron-sulfur cluster-binding protein [Gammaproteobacteria bacterium]|jgi:2Fe-2S ferredoxin
MPVIHFVTTSGEILALAAENGRSIMEVAKANDLPMLAACGGALACATCHVIVDEDWYDRLDPPSEDEEDLLDTAHGLTPTSRLCCQIRVSDALDGIRVTLTPMD